MDETSQATDWPVRPALLAVIGTGSAVAVQYLTKSITPAPDFALIAAAFGISACAFCFGFAAERIRLIWAIGFALGAGLAMAGISYWNGPLSAGGWWFGWPLASGCLGIAVATPLFQTARDEGALRFPYARLHSHAWTNVVLWLACWIFVGITFLLAWLLSALFSLINLKFLEELLRKEWFDAALLGVSFGASLGLLRERDGVVRLLQRVVTAVLSILAPVLAVGLVVFLIALPLTGPALLWSSTGSATPIALSCVFGALILANAVIGNGAEDGARNPVLRISALVLAITTLPLAIIAAIGVARQVHETGWTPEGIWTLVIVVLACVYGAAYLLAVVRGRGDWADYARPANFHIAVGIALIALLLATPLPGFNAIAANDQLARLSSGKVAADRFQWGALAFDYGPPGRVVLIRLSKSSDADIAKRATDALAMKSRYGFQEMTTVPIEQRLRILPAPAALPESLKARLTDANVCGDRSASACVVLFRAGDTEAVALAEGCLPPADEAGVYYGASCPAVLRAGADGVWTVVAERERPKPDPAASTQSRAALRQGQVEIRAVKRRQVFVGGAPVGTAFD